jgi:hypothetical protein
MKIPESNTDEVNLSLSITNLHFLIESSDWNLISEDNFGILEKFFEICI